MRTARVVTGCSSASSSPLEGLLFDRYRGKKTRAALSKLAKRVEDHSLEVQRQQQRQPIVVDGGLEVSGVSDLEAIDAKLDLLDSLKFGLGYSVLQRYPIEFLDESAFELWSILAAVLFTTGFSPESIGTLFKKHPCLFASAVRYVLDPRTWRSKRGATRSPHLVIARLPLHPSLATLLPPPPTHTHAHAPLRPNSQVPRERKEFIRMDAGTGNCGDECSARRQQVSAHSASRRRLVSRAAGRFFRVGVRHAAGTRSCLTWTNV